MGTRLWALLIPCVFISGPSSADPDPARGSAHPVLQAAQATLLEGEETFRFATFGDEDFWGGVLRLHQGFEGRAHGGVGPGVSPATALAVGLKVDVDALPEQLQKAIKRGAVNLDDPAVTLALLNLDAVVGVTAFPNGRGGLRSVGIQCALCHSTVDDSLAPGIGHRLDGWANRDLNVGAIVNLSPPISRRWRRCSAFRRIPCGRSCSRGGREDSTPSSSWTAGRCGPTAPARRCSSRLPSAWPA